MDIFESTQKFIQRGAECAEDLTRGIETIVFDSWNKKPAEKHSSHLLRNAQNCLDNDRTEAHHQLRRGLNFSLIFNKPNNVCSRAAKEGLDALRQDKPLDEVSWRIDHTLLNLNSSKYLPDDWNAPLMFNGSYSSRKSMPKFSTGSYSERNEAAARNYCQQIIGVKAFDSLKNGDKQGAKIHLLRAEYLAAKYIPGNDKYERAALLGGWGIEFNARPYSVYQDIKDVVKEVQPNIDLAKPWRWPYEENIDANSGGK